MKTKFDHCDQGALLKCVSAVNTKTFMVILFNINMVEVCVFKLIYYIPVLLLLPKNKILKTLFNNWNISEIKEMLPFQQRLNTKITHSKTEIKK